MIRDEPFIAQLARLAREERTAGKWVFIPYPSLRWTLGERLLHEGCAWANLRFVTPFEVALELAAPFLVARGIHPKPEALGPSLIHKLVVDLPRRVPCYFRPLIGQPGMAALGHSPGASDGWHPFSRSEPRPLDRQAS